LIWSWFRRIRDANKNTRNDRLDWKRRFSARQSRSVLPRRSDLPVDRCQARIPGRRRRSVRRSCIDIPEKARSAAPLPIWRIVSLNTAPRAQQAEERVLSWIHENSYMPAPNHQIAGLQNRHAPELIDSFI